MALPQSSNISTYNAQGKINGLVPPAVSNQEWDNPSLAQGMSDVAGLSQTGARFQCRLTLSTTTGGLVLVSWRAVWQNATSTSPVVARTGTGVFTITVPSSVNDEYDASVGNNANITVSLDKASANLEGSTFGFVNCSASGSVITVHTANTSGSANDLSGQTIFVSAYSNT